jgi:hypothetical protein
MNGLINYWPIDNGDIRDYIGQSDMTPVLNVGFVLDRLGYAQSALYLNNGYCTVPPGVYFNSTFTITAWVNSQDLDIKRQRVIDFGNGEWINNVALAYIDIATSPTPYGIITPDDLGDGASTVYAVSSATISQFQWIHLALVYDGSYQYIYINGAQTAMQWSPSYPNNLVRNSCFIGRSNWPLLDKDANAFMDDLKIYNRALRPQEILANMNEIY